MPEGLLEGYLGEENSGGGCMTSLRNPVCSRGFLLGVLLWCAGNSALADPPADVQVAAPKGGFFSSLKQAFAQDPDQEVVRGHFDVGSPPDTHRFYCLVNIKTGKREESAVAGELVARRDKMTGIKAPAVAPLSCADAEQKGILVTTGYILNGSLNSKSIPVAPVQHPAAAEVATGASAAAVVSAADPVQTDVMAAYMRFIAGQNAHDRGVVSEVLLDSKDFVWAQYGGASIWGYQEAMQAFEEQWKGTWRLDPQTAELRIASVSPGVAVLITPLLYTGGDPGKDPSTVPIRWGGVFVKTKSGWRISSIFITPYERWRAPKSN